jgi:NADPH:quinone reductase-like Zn-dependent oxidoreductase
LNLFTEGNLRTGETALIHTGASGVGIAATQIAKSAGARVIVTVRSDEKMEKIRNYGADLIVNTKKEDIVQVFKTNKIDVVLDPLGGEQMGECLANMAPFGRWIVLATLAGAISQVDIRALLGKRLRLIGSMLRNRTVDEKHAALTGIVKDVYPYFENGAFRPVIYSIHPISDVEGAHRVVSQNENIGKVILEIVR